MKENKLLKFLLDKKVKGLPMNVGEAMSKTDTWADGEPGNMGSLMNEFRKHWENNNK